MRILAFEPIILTKLKFLCANASINKLYEVPQMRIELELGLKPLSRKLTLAELSKGPTYEDFILPLTNQDQTSNLAEVQSNRRP